MLNQFKNDIWINDRLDIITDNLNFHFGIKIHPAHNPTQSELRRASPKKDLETKTVYLFSVVRQNMLCKWVFISLS